MRINWDEKQTDVLIIGSEGAGGRAAIAAAESGSKVIIATKGRIGKSGATVTAIAGIAIDGRSRKVLLNCSESTSDTQENFFHDIVEEGKLINNQKLVQKVIEDGPDRIRELMDWGMKVMGYSKAPGPGHAYPRDIYTTGRQIVNAISRKIQTLDSIQLLEDTLVIDLLIEDSIVVGAFGLNMQTGLPLVIFAKSVVLATGGGQTVYPMSTAPDELTGDGQAMALRAGANLVDMEMIQFHPYDFIYPPAWKGLGFPFTIGLDIDIWLLNRKGERFMQEWDPKRMEHSTRDVLSIAIMNEVINGRGSPRGGAFISMAHLPYNILDYAEQWFSIGRMNPGWKYGGFSFKALVKEIQKGYAMEVAPACHFFMGGIQVDEKCRTKIPGLFAVGEVSGGLHGANRLSNVALTQIFVQGAIGGTEAAAFARNSAQSSCKFLKSEETIQRAYNPINKDNGPSPFKMKKRIQEISWQKIGVIREGKALHTALTELMSLHSTIEKLCCRSKGLIYNREWIEAIQCRNLLTLAECIARSSLVREESRGAHHRKDFSSSDNKNWLKNVILSQKNSEILVTTQTVKR